MSLEAITAVWALDTHSVPSTARMVLVNLAARANKNGVCWPSQERIAQETGLGLRTVNRAVGVLRELGLVEVKRRYLDGYRTSSRYQLTFLHATVAYNLQTYTPKQATLHAKTGDLTRHSGVAELKGTERNLDARARELPEAAVELLQRLRQGGAAG